MATSTKTSVRTKHFDDPWLINLNLGKQPGLFIKRAFDVFASTIGLIFLSPWFILIAILIQRDTPGPVFFWCQRMGKNCRPFRMLKFRTMYERPASYQGPPVTCNDDDRITPFGHWLRDTKVNELPQLWNVLIGEMSLVGPRPEDVGIAKEWPANLRSEILSLSPGITSPASVLYHDEEQKISSSDVMGDYFKNILPDKMRLDQLYVRNQSFSADLDIIFWTIATFIPRIAKIKIPEGLIFSGPFSRFLNRYLNWFVIDLFVSFIAVGLTGFLWRLQMPLNWGVNLLGIFAICLAFSYSGVNWLIGINKILWARATVEDGMKLALTCSLVTFLILVLDYFQSLINWQNIPSLPIIMILITGLLAQIGFLTVRFRFRILTSLASRWLILRGNSSGVGEKVLIIGLGEGFNNAIWLLKRNEYRYLFNVVGVVDDNFPNHLGMWVNGCLVLGRSNDIPDIVKKHDIGVVLFTSTEITPEITKLTRNLCQTGDIRIAFVNQVLNILSQQITERISAPEHLLLSQDHFKYITLHDSITGLPNKFLFSEQLHRSLAYSRRYQTRTSVMFIHVDEITPRREEFVSEDYSRLLEHIAECLLKQKRESDTLAYLDRNEFGLILENISEEDVVYIIAKRIRELITKPFVVDNNNIVINFGMSVCLNLSNCEKLERISSEGIELLLSQSQPVYI